MGTVTGMSAARINEITNALVASGSFDGAGNLTLVTRNGTAVPVGAAPEPPELLSWVSVLNPIFAGGADPTGGTDSTKAIQTALLSFGTLGAWSQGKGGIVYLPPGFYKTSNTLIIPSGVTLKGDGRLSSQIRMSDTASADVIQFSTYQSAAQATILTSVMATSYVATGIMNAFYAGIEDLGIHGNSYNTTIPSYNHGINCTTNPATSAAPNDPAFDPSNHIDGVYIQGCTGDGLFFVGRSSMTVSNTISVSNRGWGIVPTFDMLFANCDVGFSGIGGIYNNHSSVSGSSVKCYNSGTNPIWVSGTSYTPGAAVMYNQALYFCAVAVSGTSNPSVDTAHWTAITATKPAGWGCDWYWDSGAYAHTWTSVVSQEPSSFNYYFNDSGSINVVGSAHNPNYNQVIHAVNTTNPNNYSAVYFGPTSGGINLVLVVGSQASHSYLLSMQSGTSGNNVLITTDGSEQTTYAPGSASAGNFVVINGVNTGTSSADIWHPVTLPGTGTWAGKIRVKKLAENKMAVLDFSLTFTTTTSAGTYTTGSLPSSDYYETDPIATSRQWDLSVNQLFTATSNASPRVSMSGSGALSILMPAFATAGLTCVVSGTVTYPLD